MKRGQRQSIAIISDLHAGSDYCRKDACRDFVQCAYERGVRIVLVPGDLLDGYYHNHGKFELSHAGLTKQMGALLDLLPKLPGLKYVCSLGNHDHTYVESTGLDLVETINSFARKRGRSDITVYSHSPSGGVRGAREVFVKVHGVDVCMWHPRSGFSQATIRRQVKGFPRGVSPRFMFIGHWHVFDRLMEGQCEAFCCQSFQGGGSDFGQSLPGSTMVGGLIVSWEGGTEPHSVACERREYPEPVKAIAVKA